MGRDVMIARTHLRVLLRLLLLRPQSWTLLGLACMALVPMALGLAMLRKDDVSFFLLFFVLSRVPRSLWLLEWTHPNRGSALALPLSERAQSTVLTLAQSLALGLVAGPLVGWLLYTGEVEIISRMGLTFWVGVWVLDAVANLIVFDPATRRIGTRLMDSLRTAIADWDRGRRTEAPRYRAPFTKSSYRRWFQRTWIRHTLLIVGVMLGQSLLVSLLFNGFSLSILSGDSLFLSLFLRRWPLTTAIAALAAFSTVQLWLLGGWAHFPLPVHRGWLILRSWIWTLIPLVGTFGLLFAVMPPALWPSFDPGVRALSQVMSLSVGVFMTLGFAVNAIVTRSLHEPRVSMKVIANRAVSFGIVLCITAVVLTYWCKSLHGPVGRNAALSLWWTIPLAFFLLTLRPVYQAWREGGLAAEPYFYNRAEE